MPKIAFNHEQWRRVEEIYHEALEHRPESRAAFVTPACGSDSSHSGPIAPVYQFVGLLLDYAQTGS